MLDKAKAAKPKVVNGINVDDLYALIDGIRRDAAKGKTNWHVTTTWQGQTRSRAEIEGFGIGGEQVSRRFSIDIHGFLGIDPAVPPGYEKLSYIVRIKGSGTKEEFDEVHKAVMATSPNFHNLSRA